MRQMDNKNIHSFAKNTTMFQEKSVGLPIDFFY